MASPVKRRAFTLVEVLIGFAVMVVLSVSLFRLFNSANRANTQQIWYTRSQTQARSLLSQLRNDLSQATCPSVVTDGDVTRSCASFSLEHTSGTTDLPVASDTRLLAWTVATPDFQTSALTQAPSIVECVLWASGRTLWYSRTRDTGASGTPKLKNMNKRMLEDVKSVTIEVKRNSGEAFDLDGHVVEIELEVKHSNEGQFPNAYFREATMARAPVPADPAVP